MIDDTLYYTAPSDDIFEDIKQGCESVWKSLDSHPDYLKEKLCYIARVNNLRDNYMSLVAMFDHINQRKLMKLLKIETLEHLVDVFSSVEDDFMVSLIGAEAYMRVIREGHSNND